MSREDGLIRSQPGRRLFLDWAPVSRQEPNAIYNLHYLLALQTAAKLAHELEIGDDAGRWQEQAERLRVACRIAFLQDHRWWDDSERTTASQLAAALAVLTGAAEPDEQPVQLDAIAARSLDLDDDPQPGALVLASPFMHHYLFEALHAGGWEPAIVEIIRRRWGRWVLPWQPDDMGELERRLSRWFDLSRLLGTSALSPLQGRAVTSPLANGKLTIRRRLACVRPDDCLAHHPS